MSAETCELHPEALSILRHALEKDLNGRGWLKRGFVFFVREISEPGIDILIEDVNAPIVTTRDAFPVSLLLEWGDISEGRIKNKLVAQIGQQNVAKAFVRPIPDSRGDGFASPSRFHNRLLGKL